VFKIPTPAQQRKERAKMLYARCVKVHGCKCWITDRTDIRFNFHHRKMKSIFGGVEISKLCKSDADWKTIEDELQKCVLIGQHVHLAFHNFLRLFRNKQEPVYEYALMKYKELYKDVENFNNTHITKRKAVKSVNKRVRKNINKRKTQAPI
jgi:hypothetical protein